ncbi:MAG: response regulator, partial [Gammaproteobacteria bacterium]|nr:response regulator [Gammaproteobacteria bacterium]
MSEFVASHILVVDDEPDLEELMRQRMRREVRKGAVTLSFAQNGREALDILRQNSDIEIVLSDINMPVMDGLTMLENIPSINDKLKTVMISAYGDMKNIR